jgi:hypothetical protein
MTERDPIDDAALELQEEFNALISEYDSRDVVVRAVTGILATTAYAASNSPAEARELVNAMATEAREAIDAMHEIEQSRASPTGLNGRTARSLAAHAYSELATSTVAFHKDAPAILAAGVAQQADELGCRLQSRRQSSDLKVVQCGPRCPRTPLWLRPAR